MIEVRQARYFVAVAEELHFGRAAHRLQMSQPPLSQAIKQLESQLGCVLLHRTQRSVALTQAGAVLLEHCRTLLREADAAAVATRVAAAGHGGRLNLGAVASAFTWPLPHVIDRFRSEEPHVEIRVREIDSHEAAARLLDRTLDLAIVRATAPVRGTTASALFVDQFVAALPIGHPAEKSAAPLDLSALAGDTWIWLERAVSPDYHDTMAALCRTAGFSPIPAHLARSVTSQIAMVECGLGVTIVPAAAASARLNARLMPLRQSAATVGLTIMTRDDPDRAVTRFAALTKELATRNASAARPTIARPM